MSNRAVSSPPRTDPDRVQDEKGDIADVESVNLPPLTARSVILSTLLGTHPPKLAAHTLVRVGQLFEIAEGTVRVALSRMSADGDLNHLDGRYELNRRLVERQRSFDEARLAPQKQWDGSWELAIVVSKDTTRADRSHLAGEMERLKLAELREGVWMRPANLPRDTTSMESTRVRVMTASSVPDGPSLVASLWELDNWARRARRLLRAMDGSCSPAERFIISAAVVRHLRTDPLLPDELLPSDWPGDNLRESYNKFDSELRDLLSAPRETPTRSKAQDIVDTPTRR